MKENKSKIELGTYNEVLENFKLFPVYYRKYTSFSTIDTIAEFVRIQNIEYNTNRYIKGTMYYKNI